MLKLSLEQINAVVTAAQFIERMEREKSKKHYLELALRTTERLQELGIELVQDEAMLAGKAGYAKAKAGGS